MELDIETRVHRVGGNLIWDDWSWTPDNVLAWLQVDLLPLSVLAAALLLTYLVWRTFRRDRSHF